MVLSGWRAESSRPAHCPGRGVGGVGADKVPHHDVVQTSLVETLPRPRCWRRCWRQLAGDLDRVADGAPKMSPSAYCRDGVGGAGVAVGFGDVHMAVGALAGIVLPLVVFEGGTAEHHRAGVAVAQSAVARGVVPRKLSSTRLTDVAVQVTPSRHWMR